MRIKEEVPEGKINCSAGVKDKRFKWQGDIGIEIS